MSIKTNMLAELKRIMLVKDVTKEDLYLKPHDLEELFDPDNDTISLSLIEEVADQLNVNVKITFNL